MSLFPSVIALAKLRIELLVSMAVHFRGKTLRYPRRYCLGRSLFFGARSFFVVNSVLTVFEVASAHAGLRHHPKLLHAGWYEKSLAFSVAHGASPPKKEVSSYLDREMDKRTHRNRKA